MSGGEEGHLLWGREGVSASEAPKFGIHSLTGADTLTLTLCADSGWQGQLSIFGFNHLAGRFEPRHRLVTLLGAHLVERTLQFTAR